MAGGPCSRVRAALHCCELWLEIIYSEIIYSLAFSQVNIAGQQMIAPGLWLPCELPCPEAAVLLGTCPQSHRLAGERSEASARHAAGLAGISRALTRRN